MFKNKGFLYGLGLGLIIGATLLQLMNFAVLEDETIQDTTETASPSISPSPTPFASIEPVAPVQSTKPTKTANAPALPSATPVSTPLISEVEEPSTPSPAAVIDAPTDKTIVIENGMTSSQVSRLLFNEGIIKDEKAFDNSLSHLKLDRIIRVGSFTFLPEESVDDIINKITTRK